MIHERSEHRAHPDTSVPRAASNAEAVGEWLAERVAGLEPNREVLVVLPAPRRSVEEVFASVFDGPRQPSRGVIWAPARQTEMVAWGVARESAGSGDDRLDQVRRKQGDSAVDVWLHPDLNEEVHDVEAISFGGCAFDSSRVGAEWSAFGSARFWLPRWTYVAGDTPTLRYCATAERLSEIASSRASVEQWLQWQSVLSVGAAPSLQALPPSLVRTDGESDRPDWQRRVAELIEAVRAGEFEKVVAARRLDFHLERDHERSDLVALLRTLGQQLPTCTRFLFVLGRDAFLGATPERLVSKRGSRIDTQALAGSIAPGESPAAQAHVLAESRKDQLEHEVVVRHLIERLEPLVASIDVPDGPAIRELQNVLHLETEIRAELRDADCHILELVDRLHPTPAVGGLPVADSVEWIRNNESCPRGWYAGAVGWFDDRGDGDFSVALRSCLLSGSRVRLYAGAGIVADSDPELELAEIEVKLRAILDAWRTSSVVIREASLPTAVVADREPEGATPARGR